MVTAACACGGGSAPPRGLVLVVVDTLRADHLGVYGYERPTSPRIDALAAESIRFEQALAPSPWTLPSLATLMTALYPSIHGAHSPSNLQDLDWLFRPRRYRPFSALHESRRTLAEVLRDSGFETIGLVQGSYPTSVFGMSQGFGTYHENATPGIRFDVEDALGFIDALDRQRFFVYLHVHEVHSPYTPIVLKPGAKRVLHRDRMDYYRDAVPEETALFESFGFDPDYRGPVDGSRKNLRALSQPGARLRPRDLEHLVALYDRGIAYVDHWIGALVDGLEERGLLDDVILVVTSDHGEEFLEHGRLEHSFSYYEEMLRVPLVVRIPGEGGGVVIDEPVGLVDVMPTLLDALAVPAQGLAMQGESLRPLWLVAGSRETGDERRRDYWGEASYRRGDVALRAERWKYIRAAPAGNVGDGVAREELYDLSTDPGERVNRCASEPERCVEHRGRLAARAARLAELRERLALPSAEAATLDAATLEQLEELGYLE